MFHIVVHFYDDFCNRTRTSIKKYLNHGDSFQVCSPPVWLSIALRCELIEPKIRLYYDWYEMMEPKIRFISIR